MSLCIISSSNDLGKSVVRQNIKLHGCVEKGKMNFISIHVARIVKAVFPEVSTNCTNLNACASLIRIQSLNTVTEPILGLLI